MNGKIILDTEKVGLWIYPEEKIVHHQIRKFIYGEDFQNLLMKGLELFIEYKCQKWLSDDASNSALKVEDIAWGDENWKPKVLAAGWKYWALVMPKQIVGKMNMRPLIEQYSNEGVVVKVFDDPVEGFNWLKSMD